METMVTARARRRAWRILATPAVALLLGSLVQAQEPPVTNSEAAPTTTPEAQVVPAPPAVPAARDTPQELTPGAVLSSMRIRGYADVGFGNPLQEKLPSGGLQSSKSSFQIADFELFVTAKMSDDWTVLSDMLITSDFSNEFSVEMDRLLFQYNPNKYFRAGFGKFNGSVGYYSNQFHRAKFYQTAAGRPLMFADEDNGGILPVHQVGITVQGEVPSGPLGLHYIGEISNGRSFNRNSAEVQNFADGNNGKAVNVGLFVRPDRAPGLDAGFTVYRDTLEADTLVKVRETITAVHAVYSTPDFEFLNEVAILTHDTESSGARATSKSFYTQVSNRFAVYRPYLRYEYQDVPVTDPVFGLGDVAVAFGIRKAISAGLHVDIRQFAVVKIQFERALQFGVWANGANAQLAFAF